MMFVIEWELIVRLVVASVLGFMVGLERELAGQPAGERTHALVALGAATFSVLSLHGFPGGDQARVAAGVVTGIGFLGAGMILRGSGARVRGLTTAAGLWAVGGIGLAIGAGQYALGIGATVLVGAILALESVFGIDRGIARWRKRRIKARECDD
jgi:putative Mg2+ transporter-C (MgtC) family protein